MNTELIKKARKLPKDVIKENNVEKMIEDYRIAERLSKGPVPERSLHWRGRAGDMEHKLKQLVSMNED